MLAVVLMPLILRQRKQLIPSIPSGQPGIKNESQNQFCGMMLYWRDYNNSRAPFTREISRLRRYPLVRTRSCSSAQDCRNTRPTRCIDSLKVLGPLLLFCCRRRIRKSAGGREGEAQDQSWIIFGVAGSEPSWAGGDRVSPGFNQWIFMLTDQLHWSALIRP